MSFNCTKCGLCCTNIGDHIKQAKKALEEDWTNKVAQAVVNFPFRTDETGKCEKLGANNECTVYDTRPEICSIDKVYEQYLATQMTREQWYRRNESMCKVMQDKAAEKIVEKV